MRSAQPVDPELRPTAARRMHDRQPGTARVLDDRRADGTVGERFDRIRAQSARALRQIERRIGEQDRQLGPR